MTDTNYILVLYYSRHNSVANMAQEIVAMTKFNILMQSGMSSLAQANASSQMVLQLFG